MKLTTAQNTRLKEHSKHHTKTHIATMRRLMRSGVSFTKAHTQAKSKKY